MPLDYTLSLHECPFLSYFVNGILCQVEDYYEIIEEPMDFGTMRAKLHEGMYKSLEQFEVSYLHFTFDAYVIFPH